MEDGLALLLGFALLVLLGLGHHLGVLAIRYARPDPASHVFLSIACVFVGLLTLHVTEILAFAAVYAGLLEAGWFGSFGPRFDGSWSGLVYFSGINFATLGYTQIETEGPIRQINMMQSLGGFMILTWSATVLYTDCERAWRT